MRFHLELFVAINNRAFMRRTIRQVVVVGIVCIGTSVDIVNRNRIGCDAGIGHRHTAAGGERRG